MDLSAYLRERAARVEAELERVLPPEDAPPSELHRAMRYAVLAGGKRLRPILCLAAAEAAGAPAEAALAPALAVELLHAYTLVHDDLPCMDDDDLRRGRPTVHIAFGESTAVLCGDALQSAAFELAASTPPPAPAARIVRELAEAAGSRGVVGGQVEDLAFDAAAADAATVDYIHRHKTAALFRAAVRMGAIAAGAPEPLLHALTHYAVNLGLAFQITDDLLDADAGTPAGKAPGMNCVAIYGRRRAETLAAEHVELATAALADLPPGRAEALRQIVLSLPGRKQ